jgi:hypothetical protein
MLEAIKTECHTIPPRLERSMRGEEKREKRKGGER